ncbi:serine/threonine protein kinase [Sorangium cellulosum]|uniref:serine/threonine protein kinase n=1 Tax=Sorangium cellulosum TaxID=56 RepID=UPI001331263D|nr:serine/threonine-protein kinase [Sorangium cellulosum]
MKELDTPVHVGDVLLDKYTVERVLGRGGMGMVVAARHRELGELFAIKLLLPRALADAQAAELFLREARAAVQLKGEHIVRVHDVGKLETGAPYMVMEHLVGGDLQQIVFERGPLPVREAVDYVLQVCDALAEAHAQGLVHRDLKPANLFLTRRTNGAPFVKVLDFGISKRIKPDATDLTNTLVLLGSPFYMAPEQMRRAKHVDTRSDVWSMGVVLHHLVTGRMPFPAETLTEVVARVLQEEPIPPSRQRPGLPDELDTVVALCLQKRPEHRFQAIEELAAALRVLTSVDGPDPAAPATMRSCTDAAPALADTQAALDPTSVRTSRPTAEAPAPSWGHGMAPSLLESVERAGPAARSSDRAWSRLRGFPRRASVAGAALAALAIGIGWLPLSQQQRSAPAAAAIAAQEIPAAVVPSAGYEVPAPATTDTATPSAVDGSPPPAPPPSASAPLAPDGPASSSSAPLRRRAPAARRLGPAPARGPSTTAAGAAGATTAAPAMPPRKYEGIY